MRKPEPEPSPEPDQKLKPRNGSMKRKDWKSDNLHIIYASRWASIEWMENIRYSGYDSWCSEKVCFDIISFIFFPYLIESKLNIGISLFKYDEDFIDWFWNLPGSKLNILSSIPSILFVWFLLCLCVNIPTVLWFINRFSINSMHNNRKYFNQLSEIAIIITNNDFKIIKTGNIPKVMETQHLITF